MQKISKMTFECVDFGKHLALNLQPFISVDWILIYGSCFIIFLVVVATIILKMSQIL